MKRLTTLFFILFLSISISFSQTTPIPITVGPTPTYLTGFFNFTKNDYRLIVATLGIDQNFNGVEDSGDVKPAFYQISFDQIMSGNLNGTLLKELDFASLPFPTRIAIDNTNSFLYYPNGLIINKLLLETGDVITSFNPFQNIELPSDAYIASVYHNNGYLFLSLRGTNFNSFYIVRESDSQIVFETATEANPQQSLVVGKYLFILCEGSFGQNDSKLWVYELRSFDETSFEIAFVKDIEIGDTGNHLALAGSNTLIITMNGSHQIHLLNVNDLTIEKTIQLPTTSYNGPRESGVIGDSIIVTTAYDGNLYIFNFDGNQIGSINTTDKLEGVYTYIFPNPNMNYYIVAASSPFHPDYTSNDKVYVFLNFSDVAETNRISEINPYPNPANDFVKISLGSELDQEFTLSIFDGIGNKIKDFHFHFAGSEILIPVNDLPTGYYIARLITNGISHSLPFVVSH
jgi:hypothetical protein